MTLLRTIPVVVASLVGNSFIMGQLVTSPHNCWQQSEDYCQTDAIYVKLKCLHSQKSLCLILFFLYSFLPGSDKLASS